MVNGGDYMRFKGLETSKDGINVDFIDEIGAKRSALDEYLGVPGREVIADYDLRFLKALQSKILELVKDGTDVSRSRVLVKFLQDNLSSHEITMEEFDEYKKAASSIIDVRGFELDWHSQEDIRRTSERFKKICEESHNDNVAAKNAGSPLKRIVTKGSALAEYLGISSDDENEISHGRSR